jgi:hypothetical protein
MYCDTCGFKGTELCYWCGYPDHEDIPVDRANDEEWLANMPLEPSGKGKIYPSPMSEDIPF